MSPKLAAATSYLPVTTSPAMAYCLKGVVLKEIVETTTVKIRPIEDDNLEIGDTEATDRGPGSAGQSGDTQGLSNNEEGTGSETVAELLEEGQYFEASVMSGIENAAPADVAEVKTRQVSEDDVPAEYIEEDEPPK
jgi:hypothetical protein